MDIVPYISTAKDKISELKDRSVGSTQTTAHVTQKRITGSMWKPKYLSFKSKVGRSNGEEVERMREKKEKEEEKKKRKRKKKREKREEEEGGTQG